MATATTYPIPKHFREKQVGKVWRVPYQSLADEAQLWREKYGIQRAAQDRFRICLMPIDCQNTFCIPDHELFVQGPSGMGAVEDNVRLCQFIYRNIGSLTEIAPTLDTHTATQIFHSHFLVDDQGNHPQPMSLIALDEVEQGKWKVNPAVAASVAGGNYVALQNHLLHYCRKLNSIGKYSLMIWPYHAMLGGIGHALVPAIEQACFFHNLVRFSQTGFEIKGGNPLTENYSVLRPEVLEDSQGRPIAQKNTRFIRKLLEFDAVVIAGQAKSHCVAWTIDDLLTEIRAEDESLARKVYLLEDCTSPVVVPGVIDFTEQANEAFQRFADAGMHIVQSVEAIEAWPGIDM